MRESERKKIQNIAGKIESGKFDENDVDGLFIKLRDTSFGKKLFREMGDFIAHPVIREQGPMHQLIESLQLNSRFNLDFDYGKIKFNISEPFDSYIKKHMKYQVLKCDDKELRSRFKMNRQQLIEEIEKIFIYNEKSGKIIAREVNPNDPKGSLFLGAIGHLFTFMIVKPFCSQNELFEEIKQVLKDNKIIFSPAEMEKQNDKIMLCILLLLHNVQFKIQGSTGGLCKIFTDIIEITSPGILGLLGVAPNGDTNVNLAFQLISTNLATDVWCESSLLSLPGAFEGDLCLTEAFKIGKLEIN